MRFYLVKCKLYLHLGLLIIIFVLGSNWIDNNVNTVRLAWTYWGIPSSFFEIGIQYGLRACGPQSILKPNFSEFRWYSPIRPRQTHSIPSLSLLLLLTFPKSTIIFNKVIKKSVKQKFQTYPKTFRDCFTWIRVYHFMSYKIHKS